MFNLESFKRIEGFPEYYINRDGEIYSVKIHKNNKSGKPYKMKPWVDKKGYLCVSLRKPNEVKKHNLFVHRLVAIAFIPNPNNLPFINHKDRNVKNPCADNLEWCDMLYNNRYTSTIGSRYRGNECILFKDNNEIKRFVSIAEAAEYCRNEYGSNYFHICNELSDEENGIRLEEISRKRGLQYDLYEDDKLIKSFKHAKEGFKYIKSCYGVSLSYKKMFNSKYKLLLVKDNETSPKEFWMKKSIKTDKSIIYYWDLLYKGCYIGTFKGKKAAIKYAMENFPNIKLGPLQNNYKCNGAEIIKKEMICE